MTKEQVTPGRTPAERLSLLISMAVLSLLVGLVLYDWFSAGDEPPRLVVRQSGPVRQSGGQYYVPFSVANLGGKTAQAVRVEARLATESLTGEQEIDYLAGGEREEGAFVFERDPAQGGVLLRVTGYRQP